MATTIDLTNYNALVDDDGSNLVGSLINKAKFASVILTPVQAAVTALDAVDTAEAAARAAADALKAPLASPALTGTPTAPTAAAATNTTQLATTAFVAAESALKATLPGVSTVTTTGNIAALALPAGSGDLVIYLNNATLSTIQGIAAGLSGQRLTLISMGAGQVDLAHQNGSATAANRLINVVTSGNTSLAAAAGNAVLVYDGTAARWRLVSHEQGDWITPAYAGGDFTASGSMTWTVDSGDRGQYEFYLKGRELHVAFTLLTTTVGGTPASTLLIKIPNGYTQATATKYYLTMGFAKDNAARTAVFFIVGLLSTTTIAIVRLDGVNWTASTNLTEVDGVAIFRVD